MNNIRYIQIIIFTSLVLIFNACSDETVETSEKTQISVKNEVPTTTTIDNHKKESIEKEEILETKTEVFTLNILFKKMSYVIETESEKDIRKFADYLAKFPTYKAEIKAYTDSYGSQEFNLMISKKRAKSVYKKLIEFGTDSKRMSHEGFGKKFPKVSNATEEGRAKNRRVEVVVIK